MAKFPSGLIPYNADCVGCPYLDIDFCDLLEKNVDCKQCGINEIETVDVSFGNITVEIHEW